MIPTVSLVLLYMYPGDTGLRGPNGEAGIPGTKGAKGDQGNEIVCLS